MKKHLFLMVLLFSVLHPVFAYGSHTPYDFREGHDMGLQTFVITGGLAKDLDRESTFDAARVITGTAEQNTDVTISISQVRDNAGHDLDNRDEEAIDEAIYEFTIGSSGIFSQIIELGVGENHICITAEKDGRKIERSVIISRKDMEIKRELEQGIALPGKKK